MFPEDAAQTADDLRASAVLPAHVGKFSLAWHAWDDPFIRWAELRQNRAFRLLTPMIGEPVRLNDNETVFPPWWQS